MDTLNSSVIFYKAVVVTFLLLMAGCGPVINQQRAAADKEQQIRQSFIEAYPEIDEETKKGILDGSLDTSTVAHEIEQKKEEKLIAERRDSYIAAHPKINEKTKNAISDGKIFVGMNKDDALASWGDPDQIHKDVGSWGVHEQWIYGERNYLYFENGKLASWQQ